MPPSLASLRNAGRDLSNLFFHSASKMILETRVDALREVAPRVPVRYRFAADDDLPRLRRLPDYESTSDDYLLERLRLGDRVVVAEHEGELVFAAWMMRGAMEVGDRVLPLPADHAYSYKVFTAEPYRRRGVMLGYYAFIKPHLLELGVEKLLCFVKLHNLPSIRAHARAGFYFIGSARDISIFNHSRTLLNGPIRQLLGR